MILVRPVTTNDIKDIESLAQLTGTGLTTLPKDEKSISEKVQSSLDAFTKELEKPHSEYYLFVLEDTSQSKVVGTSALLAAVGLSQPFYTYKLGKVVHSSQELNVYNEVETLYLGNDYTGTTEICTLFLSPEYRKNSNGKLLSKARFLFMAQYLSRFANRVIAEMRGVSDDNGLSPFWESLGKRFFSMEFADADSISGEGSNLFIAELMPKYPIYIPLLTPEAQAVIGEVHPQTKPAVRMLEAEGFRYRGYVDIFDAGPTLEVSTQNIQTLKQSKLLHIKSIKPIASGQTQLLSNIEREQFRATLAEVELIDEQYINISPEVADGLQVETGDTIRLSSI